MISYEEIKCLVKHLLNPFNFIHAAFYWIKGIIKFFVIKTDFICRTNIYQYFYYPSYLRSILSKKIILEYDEEYIKRFEDIPCATEYPALKETSITSIRLATLEIQINDIPNWFAEFEDIEDTFSLHRWGWMLMLATNNPSLRIKEWGIRVMKDWFLNMNNKKRHPAWESYSLSERIVNGLLLLYLLRKYSCCEKDNLSFIGKNFIDMAIYLANHIEFHGEYTHNHVLNNARALYMLGRFSSFDYIADIGKMIFINETPKLITTSGFLKADSSNYHFLLLRTFLEILWVANLTGDISFAEKIKLTATKMVKAAWFFEVYNHNKNEWNYPFIGDVTPDFPAEWFKNINRSKLALSLYNPCKCEVDKNSGWNKIWN